MGQSRARSVQLLERRPLAALVDLALDGVVEQLQALRNDQQDADLEIAERPEQDRRLAADRVDDAAPACNGDEETAGLLEDVRQRQDREQPFLGTDREDVGQLRAFDARLRWVSIAPFGLAGRARGEQDLEQVVRTDVGRRQRLGRRARSGMRSMRITGSPSPRAWAAVCCEAKTRLARVLARDLGREVRRASDVERDEDETGMDRAQQGDAPLRSVDGPDRRPVAGEAPVVEDAGNARHDGPGRGSARSGSGSRA